MIKEVNDMVNEAKLQDLGDEVFDFFINDDKSSKEERQKMNKIKDKYGEKVLKGMNKAKALDILGKVKDKDYELAGKEKWKPDATNLSKDEVEKLQKKLNKVAQDERDEIEAKYKESEKLSDKQRHNLEKTIYSKDKKTKTKIFNVLKKLYTKLTTVNEAAFNTEKDMLTDEELSKILKLAYSIIKRNSPNNIKETLLHEAAGSKLPNNIVTRAWKQIGSPRSKDKLVKLLKHFKLNDTQIYNSFNHIGKGLSYNEIIKYDIDVDQSDNVISEIDLEKLAKTLGKFKLNQFLIKLKNDIG